MAPALIDIRTDYDEVSYHLCIITNWEMMCVTLRVSDCAGINAES